MSKEYAAQIQTLGAALVGFTGVVGLGGFLILYHGGAAVKAPAISYAPVDAASSLSIPVPFFSARARRSGAPSAEGADSSPAPLLPAEVRDAAQPAAVPAARAAAATSVEPAAHAAAAAFAAPKLVASPHLDIESSASSSASMSMGTRPAQSPSVDRQASAIAVAVAESKSRNAGSVVASIVHYGVSTRADLMGRAAGPVYNFAGASAK